MQKPSNRDDEANLLSQRPLPLRPLRPQLALNAVEQTWLRLPPPANTPINGLTQNQTHRKRNREANDHHHRHHRVQNWDLVRGDLSSILRKSRDLESKDDDGSSTYFVDADGNEMEPYSMAWRYLGMYMDCDLDESYVQGQGDDRQRTRQLGDSEDGEGDCERVLLWAAVSNVMSLLIHAVFFSVSC